MKSILTIQIYILVFTDALAQPSILWNENYTSNPNYYYYISNTNYNSGNIIISGTRKNNNTNDLDPYVVKYNSGGNQILTWINNDSTYNESNIDLAIDSINNLYILLYRSSGNITISDTIKLIKIDGINGQKVFEVKFTNELFPGVLRMYNDYLYIVCGFPNYNLYKYDFNGNYVWNLPINGYRQINNLLFHQDGIFIVGDSVTSSSSNILVVEAYDTSGTFKWKTNTIQNSFFNIYKSSVVDNAGNIWITSLYYNVNNYGKVDVVNNLAVVYDTTIGSVNQIISTLKLYKNSDTIYVIVNYGSINGGFSSILQYNNFNNFIVASIDSVVTVINAESGVDMTTDSLNNKYIFNTKRGPFNTDFNYLVTKFDSHWNFEWEWEFSNTIQSRDEAFKIFADKDFLYLVGAYIDFPLGINPINIIKLDLITGINEVIPSDSKLNVFPNPMSGKEINFSLPFVNTQVSVIDIFGRTTERIENFSGTRISLPKKLSPGFYTLVLENPSGRIVRKIIVNE